MGSTAFGYNEVYSKYLPFILKWKALHQRVNDGTTIAHSAGASAVKPVSVGTVHTPMDVCATAGPAHSSTVASRTSSSSSAVLPPPVFVVSVDVRKCFDNIKRDKMIELLESVFVQDGYSMQRYAMVYAKLGQIYTQYKRQVPPSLLVIVDYHRLKVRFMVLAGVPIM